MMEVKTYIWERYGTMDHEPGEDDYLNPWTPRTSYDLPIEAAVDRYLHIVNEQFMGGNPLPARVLAVEVGGHRQEAREFEPKPVKVKLEAV